MDKFIYLFKYILIYNTKRGKIIMMKKIEFRVIEFKEGKTTTGECWNDSAYDVIETPSELIYECDGMQGKVSRRNADKIELVELAIEKILFDYWYKFHQNETFADLGLVAPEVFDPEENKTIIINRVGDYVDNGKNLDRNYSIVMDTLRGIARGYYDTTLQSIDGDEVIF